jgi:hypothetical protein
MARKPTVNREVVLQMLREGKTSQFIGDQFGVSRQAIDLYRKQFNKEGLLAGSGVKVNPLIASPAVPVYEPRYEPRVNRNPLPSSAISKASSLSLDQMVDVIIEAFSAMKRIPELEAELNQFRSQYEKALKEVEELKLKEQKRKEQEARWIHAQQPGVITGQ